jgi:DNA-directed RNA polymerase specialized sigma24 family protein
VLRLRYAAGLTVRETATALGISATTVQNDLTWASAWLRVRL